MNTDTKTKYQIVSKTKNQEDHGKWYQSILTVSDMIDYSDVSGCYVLKPSACQIWNLIKEHLNKKINEFGVEETYFPLFASESSLKKESQHFNDFVPEVAWVNTSDTHNDKLDDESKNALAILKSKGLIVNITPPNVERFAIRPTSETIIYPLFAEWIKKGPYPKIHQWANVVRWENKETKPFIRSREFLWNEGHTTHQNEENAIKEMWDILNMYKDTYEKVLAVPVVMGIKTKSETFPGAQITSTIEAFLPDSGRAIQAATSHYLGTKFSKIFNIRNSDGEFVFQNSWGFTTRCIGIMIMSHSDNKGLVLPPIIAPIQVVMIACGITKKISNEIKEKINNIINLIQKTLQENNIRYVYDISYNETPGMKFNKWECKGVPLRIEIGPRDIESNTVLFVTRYDSQKTKHNISDVILNNNYVKNILCTIHTNMLEIASNKLYSNIVLVKKYSIDNNNFEQTMRHVIDIVENKKLALIELDQINVNDNVNDNVDDNIDDNIDDKFEEYINSYCKSHGVNSTKVLCIPDQNFIKKYTDDISKKYVLFGKSY